MTDRSGVLWFLDACIAHGIPQERPDFQRARNAVAKLMEAAEHVNAMSIQSDAHNDLRIALKACRGDV